MEAHHFIIFLPIFIILLLIILSAFFSASEKGFTSLSVSKIHKLTKDGNKRAKIVGQIMENKEKLISTILLGNNIVNILASALATKLFLDLFGNEGILYATIFMTIIILFFGEIIPKTYAFYNSERLSLFVAPLFIVIMKILYPLTFFIQKATIFLMRMLRIAKGQDSIMSAHDELRGVIDLYYYQGNMMPIDKNMLEGVLYLAKTDVGSIINHRKNIEMINVDDDKDDIINQVLASSFSRFPIWKGNKNNIIGVIHTKTLIKAFKNTNQDVSKIDIMSLAQEPWFIPDTTLLKEQLKAFLKKHMHLAIVVDEYGEMQGIVTLEDIVEEIVGNINDEHDKARINIREVIGYKDCYLISGELSIREINRELGWDLPEEEANTIAGLVIEIAGNIPNNNQIFSYKEYDFKVIAKKKNQLTTIQITKNKEKQDDIT